MKQFEKMYIPYIFIQIYFWLQCFNAIEVDNK